MARRITLKLALYPISENLLNPDVNWNCCDTAKFGDVNKPRVGCKYS